MGKEARASLLERLFQELRGAGTLAPCQSPDQIVPGEGAADSGVVVVGEAPGRQEELAHRPFVGPAGKLLRSTLQEKGVDPDGVWITNVVKCRPTRTSGGRQSNRAPTRGEAILWLPWLMRELEILSPEVILCLGNLAASTLIHKDFKMGTEHGVWFGGPLDSQALATYHPSYVLRQIGSDPERARAIFADDVGKVAKKARDGGGLHLWHEGQ